MLLHFRTPLRVRVRATVKLSAVFFYDESSITKGGVRKCNSADFSDNCMQSFDTKHISSTSGAIETKLVLNALIYLQEMSPTCNHQVGQH